MEPLGTPIFTPYLEMPHLEDYGLNVVTVAAPQENRFQFTDEELKSIVTVGDIVRLLEEHQ